MGIAEVITAPRSPWQNPYIERLIGSIRRECLDHVIILNECHCAASCRATYASPFGPALLVTQDPFPTFGWPLALGGCTKARLVSRHPCRQRSADEVASPIVWWVVSAIARAYCVVRGRPGALTSLPEFRRETPG
jgi:Integrase core domain